MGLAGNTRVLFVQRSLAPPGGGNGVAAWMVHALSGWADVTTLTLAPWSPAETNAFYGTAIPTEIPRVTAAATWRPIASMPEHIFTRLRMSAVLGRARSLASQYDLMITADNFASFQKPGLQYVHFPARLQPEPATLAPLVAIYFGLCDRVLGAPWTDATRNATLANSQWTARGLAALGEITTAEVLYPPVVDPGPGLPWRQRDNSFLCVGRFSTQKRIEVAMSIVDTVRQRAIPDARLIIIGSAVDRRYSDRLRRLADGRAWIAFREDLSRTELLEVMRHSRYGIQPMIGEHFGMAAAEMTRAGCLVFAHNSGGTPEVLDNEAALLWSSESEACDRIASVDPDALQPRLRDHAGVFLSDVFVRRFRELVSGYVSRLKSGSASNS